MSDHATMTETWARLPDGHPGEGLINGVATPQNAWQSVVDRLTAFENHSCQFEDEGLTPPTQNAIVKAQLLLQEMREKGYAVPQQIVPTGDGGISLTRTDASNRWIIEIDEQGGIELFTYEDSRLTARQAIRLDTTPLPS
jgi:hypothetical protein